MNEKQKSAVRSSIGEPALIPVCVPDGAKEGKCFFNAKQVADELGGSVQYGWALIACDGWVMAANHAVWRRSDGKMIDITPDEDYMGNEGNDEKRYFVPDDKAVPLAGKNFRAYAQPNKAVPIDPGARKTVRKYLKYEWSDWSAGLRYVKQNDHVPYAPSNYKWDMDLSKLKGSP